MILALLLACVDGGEDTGEVEFIPVGDPRYERDPALDVDLQSESGTAVSHNQGLSCQSCHQAHGPGRGRFTVAGTAYRADGTPATEGSIRLSDPDGTLVLEVPIDTLGNFYTTADVGFPDAVLVPSVHDATGARVNAMPWPTISGACNHCHAPDIRVTLP